MRHVLVQTEDAARLHNRPPSSPVAMGYSSASEDYDELISPPQHTANAFDQYFTPSFVLAHQRKTKFSNCGTTPNDITRTHKRKRSSSPHGRPVRFKKSSSPPPLSEMGRHASSSSSSSSSAYSSDEEKADEEDRSRRASSVKTRAHTPRTKSGDVLSSGDKKIPRPTGEVTRPNRGGYSLRSKLRSWKEDDYKLVKVSLKYTILSNRKAETCEPYGRISSRRRCWRIWTAACLTPSSLSRKSPTSRTWYAFATLSEN